MVGLCARGTTSRPGVCSVQWRVISSAGTICALHRRPSARRARSARDGANDVLLPARRAERTTALEPEAAPRRPSTIDWKRSSSVRLRLELVGDLEDLVEGLGALAVALGELLRPGRGSRGPGGRARSCSAMRRQRGRGLWAEWRSREELSTIEQARVELEGGERDAHLVDGVAARAGNLRVDSACAARPSRSPRSIDALVEPVAARPRRRSRRREAVAVAREVDGERLVSPLSIHSTIAIASIGERGARSGREDPLVAVHARADAEGVRDVAHDVELSVLRGTPPRRAVSIDGREVAHDERRQDDGEEGEEQSRRRRTCGIDQDLEDDDRRQQEQRDELEEGRSREAFHANEPPGNPSRKAKTRRRVG